MALGKEMDAVFGVLDREDGDEEEAVETTALLGSERLGMRRASLGTYT